MSNIRYVVRFQFAFILRLYIFFSIDEKLSYRGFFLFLTHLFNFHHIFFLLIRLLWFYLFIHLFINLLTYFHPFIDLCLASHLYNCLFILVLFIYSRTLFIHLFMFLCLGFVLQEPCVCVCVCVCMCVCACVHACAKNDL